MKNPKRYYISNSKYPHIADPNLACFRPTVQAAVKDCLQEQGGEAGDELFVYCLDIRPVKKLTVKLAVKYD